jgi:hypothetical protein
MNITESDLKEAVSGILSKNATPSAAALICRIIDQNETPRLLAALMSHHRLTCQDEKKVISQTMLSLEAFAEQYKILSCIVMSSLWEVAGSYIGMHDVCDSICLWLDDCKNKQGVWFQIPPYK